MEIKNGLCYVVCSDQDRAKWELIFENLIRPAVLATGFNDCVLGAPLGDSPMEEIITSLLTAELVVIDVTGHDDPTVFYQLGLRHARAVRTVLIAQRLDDIPMALRPYHKLVYRAEGLDAPQRFSQQLQEIVARIRAAPDKPDNPVLTHIASVEREIELKEAIQRAKAQQEATVKEQRRETRAVEPQPAQRPTIKFTKVT